MNLDMKIGYMFKDFGLLGLALTHSSYRKPCNEQLELLGDAVLNMIVAESLVRATKWMVPEGKIAQRKASLVSNDNLYQIALVIGLGEHLILGRSEEFSGGRDKKNILADAMEALIGAVYMDGGLSAAKAVVSKLFSIGE